MSMKIGITCQSSTGGSGILATELGMALGKRGHEVHFVTTETPVRLGSFQENVYNHWVDMITYPLFRTPPYSLALASKISEVAEEFDIQMWHAHYAIPNAVASQLARDMLPKEKRFSLVTTLHGTDITLVGGHPTFYRATRYGMESSDAVTSVSNWLNDETMNAFNLTRPVRTIYNFVDAELFRPRPTNRAALAKDDEKIVMHISNFRPVKRVTDVVRAFRKMLDQVNARLIMLGDGPERIGAMGVARQLGITDRITCLGNVEHVEAVLPAADLVFQPSEHESFGLVPLEAMACEVPVLVTASGGITEVVEQGVSGYLCEVGDIDAMARYGIEILSDPVRAKAMGRRGREQAIHKFSPDKIVSEYEALYEELLARRDQESDPARP
jgi:N-acetyl-alpha-D-glucosaminyl L-malate synthase BshA